jgi:SAM-dependent methyltransferase
MLRNCVQAALGLEPELGIGDFVTTRRTTPVESTAFSERQYDLPYSVGVERHFWNYARLRIIERHLRRLNRRRTSDHDAIILDVGCGVGLTVAHLRGAGFDCFGVELGHPKIRPGLDNFVTVDTDANHLPFEIRERTDTILLLDVVEHIQDPVVFIEDLRANFPSLRHILITVPARMELWSNYDTYYGHFLRYDKPSLVSLFDPAALEIITLKYIFISLYPVMWLLLRLFRRRSLTTTPPSAATAWFHRLLGIVFEIEERLPLSGSFLGTSLLAVLTVRNERIHRD